MTTKNGRVASLVLVLGFFFCSSEAQAVSTRYGVNRQVTTTETISECEITFSCTDFCSGPLAAKCNQAARNYCNAGDTFVSSDFAGVSSTLTSCDVTGVDGQMFCLFSPTFFFGTANCVGRCNALCERPCPDPEPDPECITDEDCGAGLGFVCTGGVCEDLEQDSPVLVSLGDGSFELTSWQEGVSFDLDADGFPELTAWTAAGTDDAFLVLDRNGNGLIDDGSELFGNYTEQEPSDEPNGFLALALYDTLDLGGDGDGVITAADWVFSQLQLWFDDNHNGFSEIEELSPFSESLLAIDLDYQKQQRVDRHGNELRYKAKAFRYQGGVSIAYDVFFVTAP